MSALMPLYDGEWPHGSPSPANIQSTEQVYQQVKRYAVLRSFPKHPRTWAWTRETRKWVILTSLLRLFPETNTPPGESTTAAKLPSTLDTHILPSGVNTPSSTLLMGGKGAGSSSRGGKLISMIFFSRQSRLGLLLGRGGGGGNSGSWRGRKYNRQGELTTFKSPREHTPPINVLPREHSGCTNVRSNALTRNHQSTIHKVSSTFVRYYFVVFLYDRGRKNIENLTR